MSWNELALCPYFCGAIVKFKITNFGINSVSPTKSRKLSGTAVGSDNSGFPWDFQPVRFGRLITSNNSGTFLEAGSSESNRLIHP
jgi:hypothetical protein